MRLFGIIYQNNINKVVNEKHGFASNFVNYTATEITMSAI